MATYHIQARPGSLPRPVLAACKAILVESGRRHGFAVVFSEAPARGRAPAAYFGAAPDVAVKRGASPVARVWPVRVWAGFESPLRGRFAGAFDYVVITPGADAPSPGAGSAGRRSPHAIEELAFATAAGRRNEVTFVDWPLRLTTAKGRRSGPRARIGALTAPECIEQIILAPEKLDVVVVSPASAPCLVAAAAAAIGGVGVAAMMELDVSGDGRPPGFYAGFHHRRDVGNTIALVWAGSLLLDHLGEHAAATAVREAITATARAGLRTRDLGGTASAVRQARAIQAALQLDPGSARR